MKIQIATFNGVPLYLHWTWFLLPPFVMLFGGAIALAIMLAAMLFVTLHEYGHCLAAQCLNMRVKDVTLYPLGGLARLFFPPGRAKEEFLVAIAGPAVNLLIAMLSIVVVFLVPLPDEHVEFQDVFRLYPAFAAVVIIFWINVIMLVFNMLPVFPMDGGRVFRSFLTFVMRNYLLATVIAVRVAQVLCVVLIGGGLYLGSLWIPLIFLFMFLASQNELVAARHYTSIHTIRWKVSKILGRPELETAPLSQVIAAIEDEEDEELRERLNAEDLIPLLRDLEIAEKPR